jgi:hypothetical protein
LDPAVTRPKLLGYSSLRPTRLESHVSHLPVQSARQSVQSPDSAALPRFVVPSTSLFFENLITNSPFLLKDLTVTKPISKPPNVLNAKKRLFFKEPDAFVYLP